MLIFPIFVLRASCASNMPILHMKASVPIRTYHIRKIFDTRNFCQAVRPAENHRKCWGDGEFYVSGVIVKIPYGISIQTIFLVSSRLLATLKEERQDDTADSRKWCNILGYWLRSGSAIYHPIILYIWKMRLTTFILGRGGIGASKQSNVVFTLI